MRPFNTRSRSLIGKANYSTRIEPSPCPPLKIDPEGWMVCCTIVRLAGLAYIRGRSFRRRLLSLVRPDPVMIRRGVIAIKPAENNDGPGHGPRTMTRLNILLILKSPLHHS